MKLLCLLLLSAASAAAASADVDGAVAAAANEADGAAGRRGRELEFGYHVVESTEPPTDAPTPATFVSVVLAVAGLSNPPTADEELALRTAIASLLTGVDSSDVTLVIATAADRRRRLQEENLDLVSVEVKCVENCDAILETLEAPTLPTDLAAAVASGGALPDFAVGCVGEPALSEQALPCDVTAAPTAGPTSAPTTLAPTSGAPTTLAPTPTDYFARLSCLENGGGCSCCSECEVKGPANVNFIEEGIVDLSEGAGAGPCLCLDLQDAEETVSNYKVVQLSDKSDCAIIGPYVFIASNDYMDVRGGDGEDVFVVRDSASSSQGNTSPGFLGLYGDGGRAFMYAKGSMIGLNGGDEGDELEVNGDSNVVYGYGGDDALFAQGTNNLLYGDDGDDFIFLGNTFLPDNEAGTAYGGEGDDKITAYGNPTGTHIYGDEGNDGCYLNVEPITDAYGCEKAP